MKDYVMIHWRSLAVQGTCWIMRSEVGGGVKWVKMNMWSPLSCGNNIEIKSTWKYLRSCTEWSFWIRQPLVVAFNVSFIYFIYWYCQNILCYELHISKHCTPHLSQPTDCSLYNMSPYISDQAFDCSFYKMQTRCNLTRTRKPLSHPNLSLNAKKHKHI